MAQIGRNSMNDTWKCSGLDGNACLMGRQYMVFSELERERERDAPRDMCFRDHIITKM